MNVAQPGEDEVPTRSELLHLLPSTEARALLAAPERHRNEIERALARLGESEGE